MTETYGTCIYCGQSQIIRVPENTDEEEKNREATKLCKCDEAKEFQKIEQSIDYAQAIIEEEYGADKDGIRHKDAVGRLKKWMTYRFSQNRNANNMRLYGEFLYVFCGNILVTVYIVPNELRKLVFISAKNKTLVHKT